MMFHVPNVMHRNNAFYLNLDECLSCDLSGHSVR